MPKKKLALLPGTTGRLCPVPPPTNRPAPQYSRSLWYGLYFPQLTPGLSCDQQRIRELAFLCMQVSDHVSIAGNHTLVLEVRSSLKYFGGISRIRKTIQFALETKLQQWNLPVSYYDAASPSASASILLAQTRRSQLVSDPKNLRSALGSIAIVHLALDKRLVERLEQCGLLYMRDIWRLPAPALRIRFGRRFSDYLEQLLAQRPSTLSRWKPAISFNETLTPDNPAENQQDILSLASDLLEGMQEFLQKNHLSTDHVSLSLHDESGSVQSIKLGTRKPVREKAIWLLLLENRITDLKFNSRISSLNLTIMEFLDYRPLGANPKQRGSIHDQTTDNGLLGTLSARLGDHAIFCLNQQQDYDPAAAGKYLDYPGTEKLFPVDKQPFPRGFGEQEQQPCWLLSSPLPLKVQHQSPVYLSPLTFLRGPERIETHWWSGKHIRRDYYIASNQQGMMLWVYRDIGERLWFLQGLFA